jgi:hypothetical protein
MNIFVKRKQRAAFAGDRKVTWPSARSIETATWATGCLALEFFGSRGGCRKVKVGQFSGDFGPASRFDAGAVIDADLADINPH